MGLVLKILTGMYAVCRLAPDADLPGWAMAGSFHSFTRTDEELSVVCEEMRVPPEIYAERSWRGLKIEGPLDFALVGVLLKITEPLAKAGISLFAVSTFDTDYVFVKDDRFSDARNALAEAGHCIRE